ncbi:PerC family transcriptional regulator, partial [Martelella alba]|uniref:PerC family transcriptional regulator n=1 Tax=Martelella alba TaxID=2590451 RepID=UPI001E613737
VENEIALAEHLETAGLWRRAARQWLAVLDILPASQEQRRSQITARRAYCITMGNYFCNDYAGISEARLVDYVDGVAA